MSEQKKLYFYSCCDCGCRFQGEKVQNGAPRVRSHMNRACAHKAGKRHSSGQEPEGQDEITITMPFVQTLPARMQRG